MVVHSTSDSGRSEFEISHRAGAKTTKQDVQAISILRYLCTLNECTGTSYPMLAFRFFSCSWERALPAAGTDCTEPAGTP